MDGSGSSDLEGNLTGYQWTQTSGPAVTLNNATSAVATFHRAGRHPEHALQFELTVTDDTAQTGTDSVNITVQPVGGGGDTTPPVTTGTFTRTTSQGKVYYAITLSADEPATTHFRLTGQAHITAGGAEVPPGRSTPARSASRWTRTARPASTTTRWTAPATRKPPTRRCCNERAEEIQPDTPLMRILLTLGLLLAANAATPSSG